jgi:urease accessory protein
MLLVHNILGRYDDKDFIGRIRDKVWITASDAGRRRLRTVSGAGEEIGIDFSSPNWLFDGAVIHDNGTRVLVVARQPELVMVIASSTITPEQAFQIGHALGNRHMPAEFHKDEILVPVTDTHHLTARPIHALGFHNIAVRFEQRAFAVSAPPSGTAAREHKFHSHLHA